MSKKTTFTSESPHDFCPTGNPFDPEEQGLLIGVGAQYTVHDLGNGRVVKIPNCLDGTRLFVGGWGPQFDASTAHGPIPETEFFRAESVPHVLRLTARYPALFEALGKPQARPGNIFTQDKVRPLVNLIPTALVEDIKRYLNDYADLHLLCWRHGIHDRILNFGLNNGLTPEGHLVLVDFGETTFETWRVAEAVASLEWAKKAIWVEKFLPEACHDHYFQVMTDELSAENFERLWGADLDDLDKELIRSPRLRERKEEIPSLVTRILDRANGEDSCDVEGVSPEALNLLTQYPWRACGHRLQNELYQLAQTCRGRQIQLEDIPEHIVAEVNGE